MKTLVMTCIALLLFAAQFYNSYRIWNIVPTTALKSIAISLFNAVFVFMILAMLMQVKWGSIGSFGTSAFIYKVGTAMVFILLYSTMTFLLADILRLCHLLPPSFLHNSWRGSCLILLSLVGIFSYANINYNHKHKEVVHITTEKKLPQPLKILFMSDLHIGYLNQRDDLTHWIELANAEKPDLILLGGDLVDHNVQPIIDQDIASVLKHFNAPIYACLGNHEYLNNYSESVRFYKESGIHLLQDSSVILNNLNVVLIGRTDRSQKRRKSLDSLTQNIPQPLFSILLDHQPFNLDEAENCHIDLQLSGHTHNGQMWPINLIVNALYECGYGSHQRNKTHYYVSSGIGIWGARFRTASQSEYVVININ